MNRPFLDVIFYGQMINQTPDNGDTGKQILELLADTYKQDIPAPGIHMDGWREQVKLTDIRSTPPPH